MTVSRHFESWYPFLERQSWIAHAAMYQPRLPLFLGGLAFGVTVLSCHPFVWVSEECRDQVKSSHVTCHERGGTRLYPVPRSAPPHCWRWHSSPLCFAHCHPLLLYIPATQAENVGPLLVHCEPACHTSPERIDADLGT